MIQKNQKSFDLKFIIGVIVVTVALMALGILVDNTCCEKKQTTGEVIV